MLFLFQGTVLLGVGEMRCLPLVCPGPGWKQWALDQAASGGVKLREIGEDDIADQAFRATDSPEVCGVLPVILGFNLLPVEWSMSGILCCWNRNGREGAVRSGTICWWWMSGGRSSSPTRLRGQTRVIDKASPRFRVIEMKRTAREFTVAVD
jgi:hypothetical protein